MRGQQVTVRRRGRRVDEARCRRRETAVRGARARLELIVRQFRRMGRRRDEDRARRRRERGSSRYVRCGAGPTRVAVDEGTRRETGGRDLRLSLTGQKRQVRVPVAGSTSSLELVFESKVRRGGNFRPRCARGLIWRICRGPGIERGGGRCIKL